MAGSLLNYPPEMVDAMMMIKNTAELFQKEMDELRVIVQNFAGESKGAVIDAFAQVQDAWNQTGLVHNETLNAVAGAVGNAYDEITAFDAHMARVMEQ